MQARNTAASNPGGYKEQLKRINKNSLPFIVLSIVHLSLLVFTLFKKCERHTLTLLLSNISFAYIFEYFVFNVFHSYRYNPKILKKRALDNALGALLSQAIYIPITATFISVFKLGWQWKSIFIIYFHVIELFFLKVKSYKLYWWRPLYTTLLLPIYFASSDYWNANLRSGRTSILWLSTYLSSGVVTKTLAFIWDIFKKQKIGLGRNHTWKEHFLISPLYMLVYVAISLVPAIHKGPATKFLTFMLMLSLNLLLSLLKIINSSQLFIKTAVLNMLMVFLSPALKTFIFAKQKKTDSKSS
ncbi:hypothetical protein [Bacillus sp. AK031]